MYKKSIMIFKEDIIMSNGKKEYLGITENRCDFQGPVAEDPVFFDVEDGEGALLKIKTIVPEFAANNQRIENVYTVPIYVLDPVKTGKVVKPYIKSGKRIKVGAYYKIWPDGSAGLVATYIRLGSGPYTQKETFVPPLPGG
jgi:hypothetical protein